MVRHLITIDDLTEGEILGIFRLADEFLKDLADPAVPHRVRGAKTDAQGCILATLFYEAKIGRAHV